MDLGISGKTALVFGASRGLGRGISQALLQEAVNLVLVSRSPAESAAVLRQSNINKNIKIYHLSLDTSDRHAVDSLLSFLAEKKIEIDILINISKGPNVGMALTMSSSQYENDFQAMVGFYIEASRLLAQGMKQRNWGRIITIASSGVCQPIADLAISNTLRAALVSWNKTLANEVAADGITVNTIIPGRIHTERVDEIDRARAQRQQKDISDVIKASQATIPMQRYGTVAEFSTCVLYLCSQGAGYITGSSIRVDGGLVLSI
ncbi:SDR family oxidoreductase [uncultured Shewanella sp.]|uniref:SDR family oxidoreductase n=1 Tax=uncultured Shewanella sp. TaxID=173975 RepID=UPI00260E1565|nr:SDR family oxidoreductase [uncultured Shewanella sp.]